MVYQGGKRDLTSYIGVYGGEYTGVAAIRIPVQRLFRDDPSVISVVLSVDPFDHGLFFGRVCAVLSRAVAVSCVDSIMAALLRVKARIMACEAFIIFAVCVCSCQIIVFIYMGRGDFDPVYHSVSAAKTLSIISDDRAALCHYYDSRTERTLRCYAEYQSVGVLCRQDRIGRISQLLRQSTYAPIRL